MIYIPFSDFIGPLGGPHSFMYNLKNYMDSVGYTYTESSADDANAVFFPVAFDFNYLTAMKQKGRQIIQRLDGVYYPSKAGAEYVELNKPLRRVYEEFATCVVFQSDYSKKQCTEMLGGWKGKSKIIINGVDTKLFFPDQTGSAKKDTKKITFISTGNIRDEAMLVPIVAALDSLVGTIEFEYMVVGPVAENLMQYLNRDYIEYVGPVEYKQVAKYLRKADILLFSQLNPACPNTIIEAVASGLPVVSFASGAIPELLSFNSDLLAEVSNETFQKYEDFSSQKLSEKIMLCVSNLELYKTRAMENWDKYDFYQKCGSAYVSLFDEISSTNNSSAMSKLIKKFFKF